MRLELYFQCNAFEFTNLGQFHDTLSSLCLAPLYRFLHWSLLPSLPTTGTAPRLRRAASPRPVPVHHGPRAVRQPRPPLPPPPTIRLIPSPADVRLPPGHPRPLRRLPHIHVHNCSHCSLWDDFTYISVAIIIIHYGTTS